MKKTRIKVNVAALQLNEGQLGWLPKNPRQWTQDDIDKTVKSLQEDPDFIEDRPLDIVAAPQKGEFVVFCGNLRTIALGIIGTTETDAYLYEPERATLEEDRATIKRRAWKDNGQFGTWDIDIINSTEWADYTPSQLAGFGVPGFVYGDVPDEGDGGEGYGKEGSSEGSGIPGNLDAKPKNAPFVCKITFPDADSMTKFVNGYKNILEDEFGCSMSESGGEL